MLEANYSSRPSLPSFMRFISSYPDPQEVCEVLLDGPLAVFSAKSVNMFFKTQHETFRIAGTTGITAPLVPRYAEFSSALVTPVREAITDCEIITTTMLKQLDDYPSLGVDRTLWEEVAQVEGDLRIDTIPIVSNGKAIGAFDMFCDGDEPTRKDYAYVGALGYFLGVWATHPFTDDGSDPQLFTDPTEVSFMLNQRQLRILELVEQGRSNSAIAVILGYSQSTVKQELQRSMRVLRTNERSEAAKRARELGLHSAAVAANN